MTATGKFSGTDLIDGLVGVRVQDGAGSLRPDGVDLVDEDDAGGARFGGPEKIPDPPGTLTNQDLVELGT